LNADRCASRLAARSPRRGRWLARGVWISVGWILAASYVDGRQSPALPDRDTFIAQVRTRLRTDEELQSQYTYLENRQEIRVGRFGHVGIADVRLFEVYPSTEPGQTYRRLLAVNGVPVARDVLQKRDEARQKYLADRTLIRARETPAEQTRREQREAETRQRQQEIVNDVFRAFEIEVVGRDTVDDHRVILVTLTPRAGVATRSRPGKYFPMFRGRAWVSEDDYQVVKVELEAVNDILVGGGIVGRIHQGSKVTLERRMVNNEVWLPARMTIELDGRAVLFRTFHLQAVTEFSDYRRFEVSTSETYQPAEK
jgi:hypothetical protein